MRSPAIGAIGWGFTFVDVVHEVEKDAVNIIPCSLSSVSYRNDFCPVILTGKKANTLLSNLDKYCEEFGTVFDMNGKLITKKDSAK